MSIPVIPETTLGDEHVYASLLVTVFTAIDAFLEGNSIDDDSENFLRLVIFAGLSLYPALVYKKTALLYLKYRKDFPLMSKKPEQTSASGE